MELVKRYIYAVTKKLPEQQRADIEKELKGLIEDMLEERVQDGPATRKDVEEVLLELGDPGELADKYRGSKRYLIGPELFTTYLSVLKIVIIAVAIAMTVLFGIESIINPQEVLDHFVSYLVDLITGFFQTFTWVTIIFGLVEYTRVHKGNNIKAAHPWEPSQLPPLPTHQTRIKRSDPIAGIIFTILFAVLFIFSLDLFGVWRFQEGGYQTVVPLFNEEVFRGFLPFICIVLAVGVLKDVMKMILGKWTITLVYFDILVSLIQFVLALVMFSNKSIWNPDFMEQMANSGYTPAGSEAFQTVSTIWDRTTEGLIYLIGVIFAIQVIKMVVKLFKIKDIA